MNKGQKIFAVVLSVIMVVILIIAIATSVAERVNNSANNAGETEDEVKECSQKVVAKFKDGKLTLSLEENCNCGKTTSFANVSDSAEKALKFMDVIKCEEVFFIKEGEEEKSITREELINKINEYEFLVATSPNS